ncbi:MFS transporter, partial [Enterobacter quasiroggenkampii]|nr:MFS transporter [Enterobacter quasiroggenkampii]
YDMKSRLSSSRMLWSALATFLASWLPGRVFAIMGKNNPNAFLTIGIILAIIFILAIGLTYFSTFERETDGTPEERKAIIEEISNKSEKPLVTLWIMVKGISSDFQIMTIGLE